MSRFYLQLSYGDPKSRCPSFVGPSVCATARGGRECDGRTTTQLHKKIIMLFALCVGSYKSNQSLPSGTSHLSSYPNVRCIASVYYITHTLNSQAAI